MGSSEWSQGRSCAGSQNVSLEVCDLVIMASRNVSWCRAAVVLGCGEPEIDFTNDQQEHVRHLTHVTTASGSWNPRQVAPTLHLSFIALPSDDVIASIVLPLPPLYAYPINPPKP